MAPERIADPVQRDLRRSKQQWGLNCWIFGCSAVLLGFAAAALQELLASYQISTRNVLTTYAVSFLILAGVFVVLFGPVSWFWFGRRRSGG